MQDKAMKEGTAIHHHHHYHHHIPRLFRSVDVLLPCWLLFATCRFADYKNQICYHLFCSIFGEFVFHHVPLI